MLLLKIITIFNWIVIAVLGFMVIMELLNPTTGGDAAGRGIGQALLYLAAIVAVVMLILNLLPYAWSKYLAFAIVAVPFLIWRIQPTLDRMKREAKSREEEAKPIFEDKTMDQLARAIRDGEVDRFKSLLQPVVSTINLKELLGYAVGEASYTSFRPEEKTACVRLLLEAGAKPDNNTETYAPMHMAAAASGNAALMRLMLQYGADPNARNDSLERPILFEAVDATRDPEGTVRALLEFGSDPNVKAVMDDDQGPVPPIIRAAQMGRWDVCATLLEKGADAKFKAANGDSLQKYMEEAEKENNFSEDGYSRRSDFEKLKQEMRDKR